MSSTRALGTKTSVVSAGAEELTQEVNEYLDPALASLHEALLYVLAGHLTFPLYQWLYQQTESYLTISALPGLNAIKSIGNYSASVQEQLILEFEKLPYKNASAAKKELFHGLVKFYKTIIVFKTDMSRKNLALKEEKLTNYHIEELSQEFDLLKQKLKEPQARIVKTQQEMTSDLNQLSEQKILDYYTVKLKRYLQNTIIETNQDCDKIVEALKDSKEDTSTLLGTIQEKINQINAYKIKKMEMAVNHLVDESPILFGISQLLNRLSVEEEELFCILAEKSESQKNRTLLDIADHVSSLKAYLLRQQSFLDEISAENFLKTVNIEVIVDSLCLIMARQSKLKFNSKWCSDKPNGLLQSLEKIKRAAMLTHAFSPIFAGAALQTRKEKIQSQLYLLDKISDEINSIQESLEKNKIKKQAFEDELSTKKHTLTASIKHKISSIRRKEMAAAEAQLDQIKNQYVNKLQLISEVYQKDSKQAESSDHFSLPKTKNYLAPGILSESAAAGCIALATVAFMTTTPIGWGIAATLMALSFLSTGIVCLIKAYNRYKKNKQLEQYDQKTQKIIVKSDEALKKNNVDSTTRRLMVEYQMTIKEDNATHNKIEVTCLREEMHQARLFINKETKKLFIGSIDDAHAEPVDIKNFQAQLRRFY